MILGSILSGTRWQIGSRSTLKTEGMEDIPEAVWAAYLEGLDMPPDCGRKLEMIPPL